MSTTRYITGTGEGILTLVARALDPEGNPISTNLAMTISPSPTIATRTVERCYSQIILVSTPQRTLESACAQFGTALTYYIGAPRNTLYSTRDCSVVAEDAYYKLEDGSWILLSGGIIVQRGSCSTVGVTTNTRSTGVTRIPEFTQPVFRPAPAPVPVTRAVEPIVVEQPVVQRIPQETTQPVVRPFVTPSTQPTIPTAFTPIQVFVPEITFTPLSPTFVPPAPTVTTTIIDEPIVIPATPTTRTSTPTPQPTFVPARTTAPQPIFGCTDPNAINYNPNATNDDGTCSYQASGGGFAENSDFLI